MAVSRAPAVKAALVAAAQTLYDADNTVTVLYGKRAPGPVTRDVVAFLGLDTEVSHPTLGRTPKRSQHERMTITVLFACWRAGTDQQAVTERCYELYDLLGEYPRTSPQETLGVGSRIELRTTGHVLDEDPPDEAPPNSWPDDPDVQARSRYASILATFQVDARLL
jgi:hypothetical protein